MKRLITYSVLVAVTILCFYFAFISEALVGGSILLVIGLQLGVIGIPAALLIDGLFQASNDAYKVYKELPDKEWKYWKGRVKQTAGKAENNYQAYKSGEKGIASAFIDTFF